MYFLYLLFTLNILGRWKKWKLVYGVSSSFLRLNNATVEWTKPLESPELPDIRGDSCMKIDSQGNLVARCLFDMKGESQYS